MKKEENLDFITQWIHYGNCMPQVAACLIKGLNPTLCKIKEEEPAYDEKNKQPLTYTTMLDEELQNITEILCEGSQKWWEYKNLNIFTHVNNALINNVCVNRALLKEIKQFYLNLTDTDKTKFSSSYHYVDRALGLLSSIKKKLKKITTSKQNTPNNTSDIGSPPWRKNNARKAAHARHSKPGASREKQKKICEIWASGKYSSRDLCAEEECAGLNMSYSTARKALRNTPDPT